MRFAPPRCPYRTCSFHSAPVRRFFVRHGSYKPRCRRRPVPRFRCRGCLRTFSRQTFRHDYRDKRPECNERLFERLTDGTGLRQSARRAGLSVRAVQKKFRKIARTCRWLDRNLSRRLPSGLTFLLDEEETYEKASIRPLTVPVVIERDSYFVVSTTAGPIRRLAAPGTRRRRRQEQAEARKGPRRDRSRRCVAAVLRDLGRKVGDGTIGLLTDEKSTYRELARRTFGDRVEHTTISSRLMRGTFNRLFPINLTHAMTRDNCGRLRRDSWLVTEKQRCLRLQMHLFRVYRNYVRQRHNHDVRRDTPAVLLGLLDRPLTEREVLGWRQDWGPLSPHPTSRSGARTAV